MLCSGIRPHPVTTAHNLQPVNSPSLCQTVRTGKWLKPFGFDGSAPELWTNPLISFSNLCLLWGLAFVFLLSNSASCCGFFLLLSNNDLYHRDGNHKVLVSANFKFSGICLTFPPSGLLYFILSATDVINLSLSSIKWTSCIIFSTAKPSD